MTKPNKTTGSAPERGEDEGINIPIEDAAEEAAVTDEAATDDAEFQEAGSEEPAAPAEEAGDAEDQAESDVVTEAEEVLADAVMAAAAEQLKKAQELAADWQGKYMRLHAEWDTYRRRTKEQQKEEKARATEKLMGNLIIVLDDFERTISYADTNGEEGLLEGVRAVQTKLIDTLLKDGLEVIDPAGEAYDALEAQAVATVNDDSVPDETVAQVYQKGYKMGKKVLRPAMVTVTTGGPKREKPADGEESDQ